MRQLETLAGQAFGELCVAAKGPIGLGVSGGSDSTALLLLAERWAKQAGRQLLALTFDHRLRSEAAEEAKSVASLCRQLGVAHHILRWQQPEKGQVAARLARHKALADALGQQGGTHLLLGHTANDQRETFLMRARQGSTWWGLAGMQALSPSPVWPQGRGIVIARPLLKIERFALRAWLQNQGADWHEDPTNLDPSYERIRMRAVLSASPDLPRRIDRIMRLLGEMRRALAKEVQTALIYHVRCDEDGLIRLAPAASQMRREAFFRLLSILIPCAAGSARLPGHSALLALIEEYRENGLKEARTLGGAWLATRQGELVLARDPRSAQNASWSGPVWDGRFERIDAPPSQVPLACDAHPMMRGCLPPASEPARCIISERIASIGTILA